MRGSNVDANAYRAAYKSYPPLDGAASGPDISNGVYKMRHNGTHSPGMASVVASYGVYQRTPEYADEQDDDEHGFANANFRGNGAGGGISGGVGVAGGGRGVVVNVAGGAAVVDQQRHRANNASPAATTNTSPEGWMTCCRPIVLLLTLVLLIIVFVLVSGVLLYINYVAYKPRQSYVEEPCEKTFCAWGAQCVTGPDGAARCQCPTHCRPHAEQPVCGSDGRTYESHCHLRMAACRARLNVRVLHDGKCGHTDPCKEKQCPFGARCLPTPDGKNVTCQCPTKCPNYGDHTASRPVCGSDGQDYENQCELRRAACNAEVNITIRFLGKCDPCEGVVCLPPAICQLDERRHPTCRCDENCPRNFDFVCGSDGNTYTNECSLRQEACRENRNLIVVYRGKCSSGINPCGSVKCTLGETCTIDKFGIARCECPSPCPLVLKPVCSNGRTYGSECEMLREACLTRVPVDVHYVGVCWAGSPCHEGNNGCRYGAVCVVHGAGSLCECPKCSNVFEPVCGTDGINYVNECVLKREGCLAKTDIQVAYVGTCDECSHKQCDYYSVCQVEEEDSEGVGANCVCPQSCDLFDDLKLRSNETVCGSNGVTYAHECALRLAACGAEQNIMVAYKGDCDLCSGVECKHGGHCAAGECVCPSRCDDAGDEPVCASNLTTFRNECELQKAACPQISLPLLLPTPVERRLTVLFYGDCRERFPVPGTFTTDASAIPNSHGQTGHTGQLPDNPSGTEVSVISDPTGTPLDGCKDIQCDFEATCDLGLDNFPRCTCQFDCMPAQDMDAKPVCASNMRIYPSLCAMKMEACQSQSELRLRPLDLCQGMEVKPCNGDKPLLDSTNKELDCGNGPLRQDCPSGSYCHQTTRFARCCLKDQSFLQNTCETSWFGCCADGKTPAQGPEQLGCPLMCGCNKLGAYSEACDPITNGCRCRPGVGGEKCDRCEPGYWGLPKISSGHHGCIPCGCSTFGSVRDDCEQMTGRCVCKPGVQGQKCTECASTAKILTNSGCLTPDIAKQPVTSCKDMTCHYSAVCMERNHFVFCECPAEATCQEDQPDAVSIETEIVCGSDGQTYPSACTLKKVACKLQKDIVVQSFGHCKNSEVYGSGTDWPVKHYTPLQFTQSDDSNSPLSKSTRHLLHIQKYPYPKYGNDIHSHTKQAFRPTPATVRVFTALLGDLCSVTLDCPILYSYCSRGACTCLPEYSESPDRQECIRSPETPTDQQEIPQIPKKYETPSFNGLSYIRLKPLKAYHKLSIEIEFKTYIQDGILFYNNQFLDSSGDYVSLAIRKGFVEFRYNLGDGPVVITSLEKVTLGNFHRVVAKRYHRDGMLQLDDGENVAGQSEGKLRALDLIEDAFLGGIPSEYTLGNTRVNENVGFTVGLQGCIKELKINRKSIELYEGHGDLVLQTKNINECSSYNHSHHSSLKNELFSNVYKNTPLEYIPEFDGTSYLRYPSLESSNIDIEMIFQTKVRNGLILYNGQLKNGRGDFVSLSLVRGHLQFRFNLGSGIANITSKETVDLGKWHVVKITRSGRHGTLQIDNGTISRGYSGLPLTELNLGLPLYIGSIMKWTEIHKLAGAAIGFKGAIQEININKARRNMSLTDCPSQNENGQASKNEKGCSYKIGMYNGLPCPLKGHPCQNGGRCISHRNNYVCQCPEDYEGLHCAILTNKRPPIQLSGEFLAYHDPFVSNLSLELSSAEHKNHSKEASFAKKYPFIIGVNQAGENDDDAENENDTEFYEQSGATTRRSKSERGTRYEFRLRTAAPDGLLLWRSADEDYFSIALVGGYPELSFNLAGGDERRHSAVRSPTRIDDYEWHTLHVRQKDHLCSIQVDNGITSEEFLKEEIFLNRTSLIYLGGAPFLRPDLPVEYYQSFQGCIHHIHINSVPINLHQPFAHDSSLPNATVQYCHDSGK